jgi:hypothetical protein
MTVHHNASAGELIAEGEAVPVAVWDFSWFGGRASGSGRRGDMRS